MSRSDQLADAIAAIRQHHPHPLSATDLWKVHRLYPAGQSFTYLMHLWAEVWRLRELVMAFGAGRFSLDAAQPLYAEGQRMLEEEAEWMVEARP